MSEEKPFVPDPVVEKYFAEEFLQELVREGGLEKKETPTANAAIFARYAAEDRLPAELDAFLRMRDEYNFVYQDIGEWRIWGEDVWLPDPAKGNLAEQIITMDQGNYLGTCILEVAASCVYIGSLGNGDAYFATVNGRTPERAEVVYWDHETNDLEFACADSLATLAYANHLLAAVTAEEEEDDDDARSLAATVENFQRIANRCRLPWHFGDLEEAAEVEGEYEGTGFARFLFYRSLWINFLLRNDGVHEMDAVKRSFGILDHGRMDLAATLQHPFLAKAPATAFYWLWRLFFFNKEEELRKVIALTKESENPLVRDLALLVEELQSGRRKLGSIDDIHALRTAFIELDLDPARAQEREQERLEAERAAAERRAADERRAVELIANHSADELIDLAWENLDSEVIVPAIYEHLRSAGDDSLRVDLRRAYFLLEEEVDQDFETEQLLEALGRPESARVAPLLLHSDDHHLLCAVGRMGDRRAAERIAPMLELRAKYHHKLCAAVEAVAALGLRELGPALVAMLDEFNYGPDDFMTGITNKELMWSLCDAVALLGESSAMAPLCAIAESRHGDLAARAIVSLGRLGASESVDMLLAALEGTFARPAMYALARIGDPEALEPMMAIVGRRRGVRERRVYEEVMVDALRAACGEAVDLENARFALSVVEAQKFEGVELHETAIRLLAQYIDDPAERERVIGPFRDAERAPVRRAALELLAVDSVATPVHYYDRSMVDALFEERGVDGLREALRDRVGVFGENLLRKAIAEGVGAEIEGEALAYAEALLRFSYYSYSYTRDEWDRLESALEAICEISTEASDRFIYGALTHPNCMIRDVFSSCDDELMERLGRYGDLKARTMGTLAPRLEVERSPLGAASWSLGGMVNGLAFTPDGERVVAVGGGGSGSGGRAVVFDRGGNEARVLSCVRGWAYDVDIHPNGKLAAVALHAGHLLLIDLDSGELLADLRGHSGVPDGVRKVRFSPNGELLASVSDDKNLLLWSVAERALIRRVEEKFDVNAVDWFADGSRVVFGTDKQVGIVDVADESAEIRRAEVVGCAEVRVFANGARIACGGASKRGIVLLNEDLEEVGTLGQRYVARIRVSADESHLYAGSWQEDAGVSRWELDSGERTVLPGHDNAAVFALALDPQTDEPYAGGGNRCVVSWDGEDQQREPRSVGHTSEVESLFVCGDTVLSAAGDGVIRWSLTAGDAVRRYQSGQPYRAEAAALSPAGDRIIATGFDGAIAFDAETGAEKWRQTEIERSEFVRIIDSKGAPVIVVGSGEDLAWLDPEDGSVLHTVQVEEGEWLQHLVPISESRAIVAAYRVPRLHLWDLVARERIADVTLPRRAEGAETYGVDVGGGALVVSRWDRSFDVLDAETLAHRFEATMLQPFAPVAVSTDGSIVACGEERLHLFDRETFTALGEASLGHAISALAFVGPRRLVVGLGNGQLVVVKLNDVSSAG